MSLFYFWRWRKVFKMLINRFYKNFNTIWYQRHYFILMINTNSSRNSDLQSELYRMFHVVLTKFLSCRFIHINHIFVPYADRTETKLQNMFPFVLIFFSCISVKVMILRQKNLAPSLALIFQKEMMMIDWYL